MEGRFAKFRICTSYNGAVVRFDILLHRRLRKIGQLGIPSALPYTSLTFFFDAGYCTAVSAEYLTMLREQLCLEKIFDRETRVWLLPRNAVSERS